MDLLGPNAKRRRSEDVAAAGEPPPPPPTRTMEATEAANPGPPLPDAAGGGGGGDVDRISGLPDAVLGEILSLLSTKEAGRTQILASRWRHVWRASPLVLDGADLYTKPKPKPKVLLSDGSCEEEDSSDDDDDEHYKAFIASCEAFAASCEAAAWVVTHVLSAHPGPVRRFSIPSLYLHSHATALDSWLSSPKFDNLQELEFQEWRENVWFVRPYRLQSPPASAFRLSATLRIATFYKCELLDSSVEGIRFPHLKQLGLEHVDTSSSALHTIISSCPVLECLLLEESVSERSLRITSNSLISIGVGVDNGWANRQFLEEVIIVDAPCLERFLYLDKTINLTVVSAPKLGSFGCLKDDEFDRPRIVFGTTAIEGLNVVSLTTALSSVKILAVAPWQCINLDTTIELLKCFPCLEKLYIKSKISREMNLWRRKHMDFIKSFDIRLKTIELEQYGGSRSQANFASFFLLNARELVSMRLDVEFKNYNEGFFRKQHGMLQMEKRASTRAQLHFSRKTCARRAHVDHVCDLSIADPFECRCHCNWS